jgi:solute carrier family 8 (sodium/calcium exchanger)
MFGII